MDDNDPCPGEAARCAEDPALRHAPAKHQGDSQPERDGADVSRPAERRYVDWLGGGWADGRDGGQRVWAGGVERSGSGGGEAEAGGEQY